jgi:glucose-6-phosphate isomerase
LKEKLIKLKIISSAALHTKQKESAVRIIVNGKNIVSEVYDVKRKIQSFQNEIIAGGRTGGFTGKHFTDIKQMHRNRRF